MLKITLVLILLTATLSLAEDDGDKTSVDRDKTKDKDSKEKTSGEKFDGCELGWFRYKDYKCVFIFDVKSTYDESHEYCKVGYGATLLNITSEEERVFWSFHLVRFSNLSAHVWVETPLKNPNITIREKDEQCSAMKSQYPKVNDTSDVGHLFKQSCQGLGTTVCEIATNKKLTSDLPAKDYNMNEGFVENKRLKFSNGTDSEFFSGVYYLITSKYKNRTFSNGILGNGKCSIGDEETPNCPNFYIDKEVDNKFANYYMFTHETDSLVQIRKFNSDKVIVYEQDKYLANFKCFQDGLTKLGKQICDDTLKDYNAESLWRFDQYKETEYFVIRSRTNNYTLGAIEYNDGKNMSVGFGLYDSVDITSDKMNDKLLFKIEPLNYTLDVSLVTIEFDKSLEDTVAANKKQISIIDTAIINNNSPATLTHEVASSKELTETFTTSYGVSQEFMDGFSSKDDVSTSSTNSNTKSKSFSDAASEAASSQLTTSVSQSDSNSDESHSSSGNSVSGNAGLNIQGILNVGGSVGHNSETGSSHSASSTTTNDHSQTDSHSHDNSHTDNHGDDKTHSNTTNSDHSDEKSHQNTTTTDKKIEKSGTKSRTYSIYKTVSLPPYSAVKISSYANFIDDIAIQFKMQVKFTASSFRRKMNGDGTNSWRTMDAEFVKYLMSKQKFTGKITKQSFDSVNAEIDGLMRASVGLESVFIAKETNLYKHPT